VNDFINYESNFVFVKLQKESVHQSNDLVTTFTARIPARSHGCWTHTILTHKHTNTHTLTAVSCPTRNSSPLAEWWWSRCRIQGAGNLTTTPHTTQVFKRGVMGCVTPMVIGPRFRRSKPHWRHLVVSHVSLLPHHSAKAFHYCRAVAG